MFILTMYSQGVILHHMLSLEDLLITYLHVTSVLSWIKYPLHKLSLMEFQVRYFALFLLFSLIDGFKWFWMKRPHKNIQLILEFLKAPFSVLHFSCCILMTFLMMLSVILLSMVMIVLSIKCDQASDLWQQLELPSELESDLWDTVDWGKKWLVDFNAGKT